MRDRLRIQIEALIVDGTLAQGTRLIEVDLADRFEVSRGSIREVMQDLARDGFVDARPRLGTFVHTPTSAEIDDFFDFLRALEAESSRLAARRATPEKTADLHQLLEAGCELRATDPSAARCLHTQIAKIARSEILQGTLSLCYKKNTWFRSPHRSQNRFHDLTAPHASIVDAIVRRDADAAYNSTYAHVDAARAEFADLATRRPGT